MAIVQCPKCGAKQKSGTHCATCGELLNVSPQGTGAQYKNPAKPEANFGMFSQNTAETPLASTQAPAEVVITEKHSILIIVALLTVCLGISVILGLIFNTNQKPDTPQAPEIVQPVTVIPTVKPQPEVKPTKTDFSTNNDNQYINLENGRELIFRQISEHANLIFNEENSKDLAYIRSSIEDTIANNRCKDNAEDIIIAMEGDIDNLKKILKKVGYRKFYTKLLNKHLGTDKCKLTDFSAEVYWNERDSTELLTNNNKPNDHKRIQTTCANENHSVSKNILNASIEFNILTEPQKPPKLREIAIGWGAPNDHYYRYYDDFVIDPYILVYKDRLQIFNHVKIHDRGRIVLYRSSRDMNSFIRSESETGLVYGRFIPDTDSNMSYFVLSYRMYDTSEARWCNTFKEYRQRLFPEEITTRPRDSQIDLPF